MKIGLHYSFQVGSPKESSAVIRQALEDIVAADRDGFSSVVFAEHHFLEDGWIPRPMQLAAAAAAITRNMRVGTDIVILALHHPVAVAEEAAVAECSPKAASCSAVGWVGSRTSSKDLVCHSHTGLQFTSSRSTW